MGDAAVIVEPNLTGILKLLHFPTHFFTQKWLGWHSFRL